VTSVKQVADTSNSCEGIKYDNDVQSH